jgi:hypothetical protein
MLTAQPMKGKKNPRVPLRTSALLVCLADPLGSPRPNRTISTLEQSGYDVWVMSPAESSLVRNPSRWLILNSIAQTASSPMRRILLSLWRLLSSVPLTHLIGEHIFFYLKGARRHLKTIQRKYFDVVIVEDLPILEILLRTIKRVSPETRVIFDAREYGPGEFESNPRFQKYGKPRALLTLKYAMLKLDEIITVSDSIADLYMQEFGRRPLVVRSIPPYLPLLPSYNLVDGIRMVHHGVANPDRKLENIIDLVVKMNGKFTLDFFLVGNESYQMALVERARGYPWIDFKPAIPFNDIISTMNRYDIGVCFFAPTTINLRYCLPNKFFEYIQARLAILSGPSPEIAKIVRNYACGVISPNFEIASLEPVLSSLTRAEVYLMKQKSAVAAQHLCWEEERKKLIEILAA